MVDPLRLLVVSNNARDHAAIASALECGGLSASIDEVPSADQALTRLRAAPFDGLLVVDAPSTPGLDVARALRAGGDLTPIVLITTPQDEAGLRAALDDGVTDVVARTDRALPHLAVQVRGAIRLGLAVAEAARARAAVERTTRAHDDVLAIVSHDLRGPLHAIGLACEALREDIAGPGLKYLGAIERASVRAERLIADLMEARAIETGRLRLSRALIDACVLVRQAAADHQVPAHEAGATITVQVPDEPVMVMADRERVLQVLASLITNALRHARGAPIELTVHRREAGGEIAVRDQGPGIGEAEIAHLFDRHGSERPRKRGPGLGLMIARGIIEAHGAQLAVTTRPDEGARFAFTLPTAST